MSIISGLVGLSVGLFIGINICIIVDKFTKEEPYEELWRREFLSTIRS